MTNTNGDVTLAQNYDPYGAVTFTSGASQSAYGYTGEAQSGDMVCLRARYYNVADGRFQSRDTWNGDANSPMSMNRWMYVEGNPVNYTDPSGYIAQGHEADEADKILEELQPYGVTINADWGMIKWGTWFVDPVDGSKNGWRFDCQWVEGVWSIGELRSVKDGVMALAKAMGGDQKFAANLGGVTIEQKAIAYGGLGEAHHVTLGLTFSLWTVVHELSHAWDGNQGWRLSDELVTHTGGFVAPLLSREMMLTGECDVAWSWAAGFHEGDQPGQHGRKRGCNNAGYFYGDKPSGSNWAFTPKEDFAESVTMYIGWSNQNGLDRIAQARITRYTQQNGSTDVYGIKDNWADYAKYFYPAGGDYTKTKRWQFVDDLMHGKIPLP